MEPKLYTAEKVNNEIELCEVQDLSIKGDIERVLLKNRISYYIQFKKSGFFSKKKECCSFFINRAQQELATTAIQELGKPVIDSIQFINEKIDLGFF